MECSHGIRMYPMWRRDMPYKDIYQCCACNHVVRISYKPCEKCANGCPTCGGEWHHCPVCDGSHQIEVSRETIPVPPGMRLANDGGWEPWPPPRPKNIFKRVWQAVKGY